MTSTPELCEGACHMLHWNPDAQIVMEIQLPDYFK